MISTWSYPQVGEGTGKFNVACSTRRFGDCCHYRQQNARVIAIDQFTEAFPPEVTTTERT